MGRIGLIIWWFGARMIYTLNQSDESKIIITEKGIDLNNGQIVYSYYRDGENKPSGGAGYTSEEIIFATSYQLVWSRIK